MAVCSLLSSAFWLGKSNSSLPLYFCSDYTASAHVFSGKIECTANTDTQKIKHRLIKKGFTPTPKIVHRVRKKEIQKAKRKAKKDGKDEIPEYRKKILEEEALFEAATHEYATFMDEFDDEEYEGKNLTENYIRDHSCTLNDKVIDVRKNEYRENSKGNEIAKMEGKPWERITNGKNKIEEFDIDRPRNGNVVSRPNLRRNATDDEVEYRRMHRLQGGDLEEFRKMVMKRKKGDLSWLLDDDLGNGVAENTSSKSRKGLNAGTPVDEELQIRWLTERLNNANVNMPAWQFSKLMHSARIKFTDGRLLRIVQVLGDMGNWRRAMETVQWVHNRERYKDCKSRYVYTTLLAILGKARRPVEALNVFHAMREELSTYPDMPAYHSIAVTLGQTGYLKEVLKIIDCLRVGPLKNMKYLKRVQWDPCLQPDVVVYNAVLNACIPLRQWRGAFWVLQQMRQDGIKPSSATYGLVMEVMLRSGKYDLVHRFFEKMGNAGLTPNALTYKVLVNAFSKEGKTDEAIRSVEEMERRGVVATASVYYELACCLCSAGRWREALLQVEKLCKYPPSKDLAVTFTGLIRHCLKYGLIHDCISIFKHMQKFCAPNIGTANVMIQVYGHSGMFEEAKALFEEIKKGRIGLQKVRDGDSRLTPDIFTYNVLLEACAEARDWEYLENVYKQMVLRGHLLDHKRHAWLIVLASRAGKWHLLDHAFDQLLESGVIPHVALYKEKICQSLETGEYAKAISCIKSMAHASLNVSQEEWTQLFKKNAGRISRVSLQGLSLALTSIGSDDYLTNHMFGNLKKPLHDLSGLDTTADVTRHMGTLVASKCINKTKCHASNITLDLTTEDTEEMSNISNKKCQDKDGIHKFNPKLDSEQNTFNPFITDAVNINLYNSPDTNFPSTNEILREWRQNSKEMDFVQF